MVKLTAATVRSSHAPGMYADDACRGLYLCVGTGGAKSWILRTTVHGRRRELGLGSVSDVALSEARDEAQRLRKIARAGGDPATKRNRESLTFAQATQQVHARHADTWKNQKHTETWLSTIENHVYPRLGSRPIETIGTADMLAVLQPIWTAKHETAKRLKQRLGVIFDWAKSAGHYHNENPINGITRALPVVKTTDNHFDAMPWMNLPAFMEDLQKREGVSARCLELIILTASRSGEARGARWEEFDLKEKVWTVPGNRMKRGIPHRIPLPEPVIGLIKGQRGLDPDYLFPSPSRGKGGESRPQSDMVFKALYERMGQTGFTTHGFRSTFRDWCSESAQVERDVAEAALHHATGNQTERAYARSDLFERRRILMQDWVKYALSGTIQKGKTKLRRIKDNRTTT